MAHFLKSCMLIVSSKAENISGGRYHIVKGAVAATQPPITVPKSSWNDDSIKSQIQNCAVACNVSYLETVDKVVDVLKQNLDNHNLRFVTKSQVSFCGMRAGSFVWQIVIMDLGVGGFRSKGDLDLILDNGNFAKNEIFLSDSILG